MILLNHWGEMTFHLKDVVYLGIYLGSILVTVIGAWFVQKNNTIRIKELEENTDIKERMEKLEEKTDNLKEIFGNLRVTMVELKLEILEEVRKIFNGK